MRFDWEPERLNGLQQRLARLWTLVEACRRVLRYTGPLTRDAFVSGTMAHDAVLRNLEILGEAGKAIPADVRALDGTIP
jgi:uncharacterized protein with HEPN domain